ncbi:MAG: hypothetical protein NC213_03365 [Acetobacter sp.]|nr:hypothetical protein [Bacteroides sp.]MCM1340762.1 hypothetical protein [Acetobacter sp.]MCM1432681.1 hypothetical protein [Clostridiales bacterium]
MEKKQKRNSIHVNKGKRFRLPLSAIVSYLLVVTLLLSGVSLARYTASATGSDSARMARFSVSATASADQPSLIELDNTEGISGEYAFEVLNDSETAVQYTVVVGNLPPEVCVSIGSQAVTTTDEINTAVFDAVNLGAGQNDKDTITFTALDDAESDLYEDISVDVQFEQID